MVLPGSSMAASKFSMALPPVAIDIGAATGSGTVPATRNVIWPVDDAAPLSTVYVPVMVRSDGSVFASRTRPFMAVTVYSPVVPSKSAPDVTESCGFEGLANLNVISWSAISVVGSSMAASKLNVKPPKFVASANLASRSIGPAEGVAPDGASRLTVTVLVATAPPGSVTVYVPSSVRASGDGFRKTAVRSSVFSTYGLTSSSTPLSAVRSVRPWSSSEPTRARSKVMVSISGGMALVIEPAKSSVTSSGCSAVTVMGYAARAVVPAATSALIVLPVMVSGTSLYTNVSSRLKS